MSLHDARAASSVVIRLPLSWHPEAKPQMLEHLANGSGREGGGDSNDDGVAAEHSAVMQMSDGGEGFELVVAADVIYAVEVVSMLCMCLL